MTETTAGGPMTAGKLRYIARSLDVMTDVFAQAVPELKINGEPLDTDTVIELVEWARGTVQQDDLRRWADELEAGSEHTDPLAEGIRDHFHATMADEEVGGPMPTRHDLHLWENVAGITVS